MIVNQTPYPISFEMKTAQALTCRYREVGRQYKFIADIDLTGLSANVQVIKPDGTFVIEEATVTVTEDEQYIVVEIPLQATVVKGVCRYDINLFQDEDLILYTAEGPLWVDDQLITEDMIESVAEVNGLVFPRDFLTVENLVDIVNYVVAQLLDDESVSTEKTWSSEKISDEIEGHTPDIDVSKEASGNPIEFSDGADAPLVKCVSQITGYQEGSGTPSPDNVRPIVAYNQSTISVEDENEVVQQTSTATFSNSIYQGNADFVGGSATKRWVVITFDGSNDEQWYFSINAGARSQNVAYIIISDIAKRQTPIANLFEGLSNRSYNDLNPWQCASPSASGNETYVNFVVDKTLITSLSDWRTWLSTNNLELAYELATPTTETITPTNLPIKSLFGYNHIESSTGNMEVEYITQTYEPIAELINRSSLHEYSTEEHIIGKWIDGKTVYERTIVIPNFSASTSDNNWYYGTVDLSTYGITPEHVFPDCAASYITLGDTTTRIPVYIDWQGGTNVYPYFIGSCTGDLILTLRYTKQ